MIVTISASFSAMGAASSHLSDDLVAKSKAGGLDRASYEPHASQWSGKAAGKTLVCLEDPQAAAPRAARHPDDVALADPKRPCTLARRLAIGQQPQQQRRQHADDGERL